MYPSAHSQRKATSRTFRTLFAITLVVFQPIGTLFAGSPDATWQQQGSSAGGLEQAGPSLHSFRPSEDRHFTKNLRTNPNCTNQYPTDPAAQAWEWDLRVIEGNLFYQENVIAGIEGNNVDSVGVDPATLRPQNYVPDFFPTYSLSDTLTLTPALAYAQDPAFLRRGELLYGSPKFWQTHYGELVRVLPATNSTNLILGSEDTRNPSGEPAVYGPRFPLASTIGTYFVSATGEMVEFYPDPEAYGADPDLPANGTDGKPRVKTWYAMGRNYRLLDVSPDQTDEQEFQLQDGKGNTYSFEAFRIVNRANAAQRSREAVSIHYRVKRITDPFGNYIKIFYCPAEIGSEEPHTCHQNNKPICVRSFRKNSTADTAYYACVNYEYDDMGRITAIEAPRYAGIIPANRNVWNRYNFYYPDQVNDQGRLMAEHAGVRFADGTLSMVDINGSTAHFRGVEIEELYYEYDETLHVDFLRFDSEQLEAYATIRAALTLPSDRWGALENARSFSARLRSGSQSALFKLGSRTDRSPQEAPFKRAGDRGTGTHVMKIGDGNVTTTPGGEQSVVLKAIGSYQAFQDGPVDITLYPIVKNGDVLVGRDGSGNLWRAEVDDARLEQVDTEDPTFSPENAVIRQTHGTGAPQGPVYHVRRETVNRVVSLALPVPDEDNNDRTRINLAYDDQTVNHGEIATIAVHHDSYQNGMEPIRMTQFEYEMVRSFASAVKDPVAFAGLTLNSLGISCYHCENRYFGDNRFEWRLDLGVDIHQQEFDVLRKKTVSYVELEPQSHTYRQAATPMVTLYGGSYNWILAGDSPDTFEPTEACLPNPSPGCTSIEWGLSGKLFDFTWQINPDGSGQVYDLDPRGTDLEPMLAAATRGSRVFKTYAFDTRFKATLEASAYAPMLDHVNHPWHRFMPQYEFGSTAAEHADSPSYPVSHPKLELETMFAWRGQANGSRCYQASITGFEPVPLFKYNQSTSPINPNNFFREDNIGAVYGRLNRQDGCSPIFFRTAVATILSAQPEKVEKFFKGRFVSTIDFQYEGQGYGSDEVLWGLGGRTDLGNHLQVYQDRSTTHSLLPAFTYQLENQDGLTWNPSTGTLQIRPEEFVSGSRFSNGGFLHKAENGELSGTKGQNTVNLTASLPGNLNLQPGDTLHNQGNIYTITQITASTLTIQPQLYRNILGPSTFYRHYNPRMENGTLTVDNGYIGHDAFGNKPYTEFHGDSQGLQWDAGDPERCLIPRVEAYAAEEIAWDDSAFTSTSSGSHNDIVNWLYFGRVGNQFQTSSKPFNVYDGEEGTVAAESMTNPLTYWTREFYVYGRANVPWQYTRSVTCNLPYVEGENGFLKPWSHSGLSTTPDSGDLVTDRAVIGAGNTLVWGRPWNEKRYFFGDPNTYHFKTFDYYDYGWLYRTREAWFKPGHPVLVNETVYEKDFNTRLPFKETHRIGSWVQGNNRLELENGLVVKTGVFEYDYLARQTRAAFYQDDQQRDSHLMDTVRHKRYPSVWETIEIESKDLAGNQVYSQKNTHRDGLDREIKIRFRHSPDSALYETAKTYDSTGKLLNQYLPALPSTPLFRRAYTQQLYNVRGMQMGRLVFNHPRFGAGVFLEGSTWTINQNLGLDGTQLAYTIQQKEGSQAGATDRGNLHIKKQVKDRRGKLLLVEDFELHIPGLNGLLDASTSETLLTQYVSQLQNPVAKAVYSFDRFDNVALAEVGSSTIQTRMFRHDRFGRLRYEDHPEFDLPIWYGNYTLHGQPGTLVQAASPDSTDQYRKTEYEFDMAGNPLSITHNQYGNGRLLQNTLSFTYGYQVPGLSLRNAYQPVWMQQDNDLNQGGAYTSAYKLTYDPNTGSLVSRELQHNVDPAWPGYTAQPSYLANPSRPQVMVVEKDNFGRLLQLQYPKMEPGAQDEKNTLLTFDYTHNGQDLGLLKSVRDQTLGKTLFSDFFYGPDQSILSFNINLPEQEQHLVQNHYDASSRLTETKTTTSGEIYSAKFNINSHGKLKSSEILRDGSRLAKQEYGYDILDQISEVNAEVHGNSLRFRFNYDEHGNMIAKGNQGSISEMIAVDPTTNRLNGSGFSYSPYGEWLSGQDRGRTMNGRYNAAGRLETFQDGSGSRTYFYDPTGNRIFSMGANGQDGRMYLYDEENMVLTEYVKNGNTVTWDRSYIYVDGRAMVTYEAEPETTAPAAMPAMPEEDPDTTTTVTVTDTLGWPSLGDGIRYDLEIAGEDGRVLQTFHGLTENRIQLPKQLPFGSYRYRLSVQGLPRQPWRSFEFIAKRPPALAAYYSLDQGSNVLLNREPKVQLLSVASVPGFRGDAGRLTSGSLVRLVEPFADGQSGTLSFLIHTERFDLSQVSITEAFRNRKLLEFGTLSLGLKAASIIWRSENGQAYDNAGTFGTGEWQHIALSFDSSGYRLYVNGVLTDEGSQSLGSITEMRFGDHSGNGFLGDLDDLLIYENPLSGQEIEAQYKRFALTKQNRIN